MLVLFGGGVGVSQLLASGCLGHLGKEQVCSLCPACCATGYALQPAICSSPLLPRALFFSQITALLSVLRAIAERHAAGSAAGLPRRVYCIWTARTLGEFKLLDASLLHAAA